MNQIETAETVLTILDQIVESSDNDAVLAQFDVVRTHLAGTLPSIVIKQLVIHNVESEAVRILRTEKAALEARLLEFQQGQPVGPQPQNGFYTLEDWLAALQLKMGRTYGWRVDYILATKTSPDCREVRNEEIQKWQKTQKVPDWAYNQIPNLVFSKREGKNGPRWSNSEYDKLVSLYEGKVEGYATSSKTSNTEFAAICSAMFGRDITENAIKGALDRLRKQDRLPKYRSSTAKAA